MAGHRPPQADKADQGHEPIAGGAGAQRWTPAMADDDVDRETARRARDRVAVASMDSFPCSDPPGYYSSTA